MTHANFSGLKKGVRHDHGTWWLLANVKVAIPLYFLLTLKKLKYVSHVCSPAQMPGGGHLGKRPANSRFFRSKPARRLRHRQTSVAQGSTMSRKQDYNMEDDKIW